MTPEEAASQYIWEVLKKIRQEIGLVGGGEAIEYQLSHVVGAGIPSKDDEIKIIRKLAKDDAVKILEAHEPDWQGPRGWFKLEILQPKFGEVYEKYRKACDLTSYLNDYQEKMFKGENLPEFSQIELANDKEGTGQTAPIKHKGKMFETGSGGGYYNRSHPIRPIKKQSANEIIDGFSLSNYAFVLMVSEGILSASEFGSNGEVNYRLQSAPGQMLVQERQLLSKFEKLGLFRNLGEDGLFGIATLRDIDTKTIRQITTEIKNRQSNLQTKSEEKNGDLKTRDSQLLDEMESKQKSPDVDGEPFANRQKREPIQIQIVSGKMEIEGLQDSLKAIAHTGKEDKHGFPYKLPAGTKWEDFTIKFEDDENVFIQVKQLKHNANYKKMGFIGRGTNPSEAWTFLKVLAKVNGELTLKDPEARDKYKKQKELLTKALQGYFSLDYDPFYPYRSSSEKSGNSYKIKVTLIPPPKNENGKVETDEIDDDPLRIKEYLEETSPLVYEKNH